MHQNQVNGGLMVQISGWGAVDGDKGENSNELRVLTQQTITNDQCASSLGSFITEGHICTTAITSSTGFCTSDVGGPLILNANLIGIATWHSVPCGDSNPVSFF